jgi:hypothetical protein
MMRAFLTLSLLLTLVGGALAGTGATPIRLTVQDNAEAPFSSPVLRLVALPDGYAAATVTLTADHAAKAGGAARLQVQTLSPMIMRGLEVLPVVISRVEPLSPADARTAELEVTFGPSAGAPARPASAGGSTALQHSRGYFDSFALVATPETQARLESGDEGSYLIITTPDLLSGVEPLAAWKREKGLTVSLVTTAQTGATKEEISSYIGLQYHTAAVPPEFVLLVGDVEQVPTFGINGNATDLPYSLQDGGDFMPDLYVGRLPARTVVDAQTMVAKILHYEREDIRVDGGRWMGRAMVSATESNAATCIPVASWCRRQMLRSGYTQVDSVNYYQGIGQVPPGAQAIPNVINRGVSLVVYRGWANQYYGWATPSYLIENVHLLSNGWALPLVCSFVCANNKYDNPECFGEAWVRAGTATAPKGGVAFIGNSEHWSHTRFNDAAAIGAIVGIADNGVRRLGDILLASKMHILSQFPSEIPLTTDASESVEFYFYIYNLLGDPEMSLQVGVPRAVSVAHPASFPLEGNAVEVAVADSAAGTVIAGARVGLVQDGTLLGTAWTDADGVAIVPVSLAGASPIGITVTGRNIATYRSSITVEATQPYLALGNVQIVDDGSGQSHGNGDGDVNPGETAELRVSLVNPGGAAIAAGQANLEGLGGADVVAGSATYAQTPPAGGQAELSDPFVVRVPATAEDGAVAQFRLRAVSGADTSVSDLRLPVKAPNLRYVRLALDGDAIKPGQTGGLTVTIRNEGSIAGSEVTAVLKSRSPELITVVDSTAGFGTIALGGEAANATPFQIHAGATAPIGQPATLLLVLTSSEGYVSQTSFSVPLGAMDITAPMGPDKYGYWAYDNADTDYPDTAPLYNWIECSTAYGASGRRVALEDNQTTVVNMPFPFKFYGNSYTRVRISDNGWIAFDVSRDYYDFYNWSIPSSYGCGAKIAPFWDNLDPAKAEGGRPVGDGIYTYVDAERHLLVVEWSRLGNRDQPGSVENPPLVFRDLQTFEVILYDPAFYPTPSGDGIIQFQYKQILNIDGGRMYATVGIENEAKDDALQCNYSNIYSPNAAPLSAGLATRITTQPPRYSPFTLAEFNAAPVGRSVLLSWRPVDARPRGDYRVYRANAAGEYRLVGQTRSQPIDPAAPQAPTSSFLDTGVEASAIQMYKIGSTDPVGRETLLGPFRYDPKADSGQPRALTLAVPNPLHGSGPLAYSVPSRAPVALRIYDVSGRTVRSLLERTVEAGSWTALWDGRDDNGRELPGGIYFARLESGGERKSAKMVMVR